MDIFTLFGDVGLNIDKASKNLNKIIDEATKAGSAFDKITQSTDKLRKAFMRNMTTPTRTLTQLRQRTEEATEAMESFKNSADLDKVYDDFIKLQQAIKGLDDALVQLDISINMDGINVDEIRQKLNDALSGIENQMVDIGVNVNANQEGIDNLKAQLAELKDVYVNVGVDVSESTLADLKSQLDSIKDVAVNVGVTVPPNTLDDLKSQLDALGDVLVNVDVSNVDLTELQTQLDAVRDIEVNVSINQANLDNLQSQLDDVRDLAVNVSVNELDVSKIQQALDSISDAVVEVQAILPTQSIQDLQDQINAIQGSLVTVEVDGDVSRLRQRLEELGNIQIDIGGTGGGSTGNPFGNMEQSVQNLSTVINEQLTPAIQNLNEQQQLMNEAISNQTTNMGGNTAMWLSLASALPNIGNGFGNMTDRIRNVMPLMSDLNTPLNNRIIL